MQSNTESAAKRKRSSKKSKRAWRNVNNEDVEAYLDVKRLEERIGKPVSERADDELFEVASVPHRQQRVRGQTVEFNESTLKCLQPLINTSGVQDPVIKRNRVRTKEERQSAVLREREEERIKKGILKKKELIQLKKLFKKKLKSLVEKSETRVEVKSDPWSGNSDERGKVSKIQDWLDENTLLHTVRNTRGLKKLINQHPKELTNPLPAFEIPHPGTSYNPTYTDHTDLVNNVANAEQSIEKSEHRLEKSTKSLFRYVTRQEVERMRLEEMSQGLPISSNTTHSDNEEQNDDTERDYKPVNPAVNREKKKSKKQRNKEKRLKEWQTEREEMEEEKKKIKDICRLKYINKEIEEEERKMQEKIAKRKRKKEEKLHQTRRVGRNKFEPNEEQFALVEELSGTLREIIPQGNILKDKFLNFQKRNIIEIPKPQLKIRKKKGKRYTVASHRFKPLEVSRHVALKNINRKRKTNKR